MSTQTVPASSSRKLTLGDIAETRAYERERDDFRAHVIELKRRRRVHVGTVVTLLFENRDTIRFQVQEMARAERIFTDEGIQEELNVYNPMVPEAGQLCATMFIELTSDDEMREWLPKLVGVEQLVQFRLPNGDVVKCVVDPQHASQLTREHITAAVHYVTFEFTPAQVTAMGDGALLEITHPAYLESAELSSFTLAQLQADLQG